MSQVGRKHLTYAQLTGKGTNLHISQVHFKVC